jgi:hypothetical protein
LPQSETRPRTRGPGRRSKPVLDGEAFSFPTLPPEILAIRDAGGLLNYTRAKLEQGKRL